MKLHNYKEAFKGAIVATAEDLGISEILFNKEIDFEKSLHKIEVELEQHIRFEGRLLFPEIQKIASDDDLLKIEKIHNDDGFVDNLEDEFWR